MVGLIIAVLVLPLTVLSQDDPCINNRMLYDDGGRSIKCSLYHPDSHDRFITEGWRRVQLKSTGEDLTMPMECVTRGYCGSHSNVWLNGTHPKVEDGIVDRMGCLSMFSSCCQVEYPIQIKNCTDYMVYNLKRTWGSDERYCFGDSTLCYQTTVHPTTKTSRPITTTSRPATKTPSPIAMTPSVTTKTSRPITTTPSVTTTTPSVTTQTSRPITTTPSVTTNTSSPSSKMSSPTTNKSSPSSKMSSPTTTTSSPTTMTPSPNTTTSSPIAMTSRPTTKIQNSVNTNHSDNQETLEVHEKPGLISVHKTDEMVTILAVCLCITIALLITLVVFFYWRHRSLSKNRSNASPSTINPAYDSREDNPNYSHYDIISHPENNDNLYLTVT